MEMNANEGIEIEVTIGGELFCLDVDGVRPMTAEEFDETVGRMADCLDEEDEVIDPVVWGQGRSGQIEIRFELEQADRRHLGRRIEDILLRMERAADLVSANHPRTAARPEPVPMLEQTSQHWNRISQPA